MSASAEVLEKLRATRARVQEQLINVTEEQMVLQVPGRVPRNVRAMFYLLVSHEAEHTVHLMKTLAALGVVQTEAQLILRLLQRSRGELEGLLLGLSDEDLDREPAKGDWSPRKVLEHIIADEEVFSQRIRDAIQQKSEGQPA